jgi:hypothetical protein
MKLDADEMIATMTISEKKDDESDPSLPPLNGHGDLATVSSNGARKKRS